MRASKPPRHGLALVELLALVAVAAIAIAIVVPRLAVTSDTAKARLDNHNRALVNAAVERWYVEKGAWPADDLSTISADNDYFPGGLPINPVSGSAYRLDPSTHRVE